VRALAGSGRWRVVQSANGVVGLGTFCSVGVVVGDVLEEAQCMVAIARGCSAMAGVQNLTR
jgi:hypothetical protein